MKSKKKKGTKTCRKNIVSIAAREATLKRRIRTRLRSLGFTRGGDGSLKAAGTSKDEIRLLHGSQRADRLAVSKPFISGRLPHFLKYFASGADIDPAKIKPRLQLISSGTWESELFRLASLTWSVPVSNGFGRRLRYLVWDDHNGKLIGLFAIGDPVFNLSVRDKLIGWDLEERTSRLVNIMDAYVLGTIPPYNALLGGKMVACLVRSRDVYNDFRKAYGGTMGIISEEEKKARLLVVTTSSSMGRSSIYNRLKLDGVEYFKSIGYTGGWGHFHIPDNLFLELRDYLRRVGHKYADQHRFGQGPNWRLRTTRAALSALGIRADLLHHGVQREVFISLLAANAFDILKSGEGRANLKTLLTAEEVAALAVERWIIPRSIRMPEYRTWKANEIARLLSDDLARLPVNPEATMKQARG
ncbi:MAG TPA: Druantia anti-phage system protein DruA [Stellaceae bacterium]|nr:Druantia anti-phage system protein DruA [Stellaceae bacterium]